MFWGKNRSTSSPSRLCCSSFSVSVLNFATSPNSGKKFFGGVSEVGSSGCVSFSWFLFSSAAIAEETCTTRSHLQHKPRDRDRQRPTPQSQSKTRPKEKHTPTTQPRRAGHSQDPGPARTPTQHTPARKGGEQAVHAHKHTPLHSTPDQEVQGTTRDGRTSTHTPQQPPKAWRGAAETQAPARTRTPHTRTENGGVQAERARNHACPICRPKPKPNHEHHEPQPAKEGQHHKPYPNTPAQAPRILFGPKIPKPATVRNTTFFVKLDHKEDIFRS